MSREVRSLSSSDETNYANSCAVGQSSLILGMGCCGGVTGGGGGGEGGKGEDLVEDVIFKGTKVKVKLNELTLNCMIDNAYISSVR